MTISEVNKILQLQYIEYSSDFMLQWIIKSAQEQACEEGPFS